MSEFKFRFVKKFVFLLVIIPVLTLYSKLVPGAPDASETIAEPTAGLTLNQLSMFLEGDELFRFLKSL